MQQHGSGACGGVYLLAPRFPILKQDGLELLLAMHPEAILPSTSGPGFSLLLRDRQTPHSHRMHIMQQCSDNCATLCSCDAPSLLRVLISTNQLPQVDMKRFAVYDLYGSWVRKGRKSGLAHAKTLDCASSA